MSYRRHDEPGVARRSASREFQSSIGAASDLFFFFFFSSWLEMPNELTDVLDKQFRPLSRVDTHTQKRSNVGLSSELARRLHRKTGGVAAIKLVGREVGSPGPCGKKEVGSMSYAGVTG